MTRPARVRIFLSSCPFSNDAGTELGDTFDQLLASLSKHYCELVCPMDFIGYPRIADVIETCDALLYVMDDGLKGSTQKYFEARFAAGTAPRMWADGFISKPIPVFLRPVPYDLDLGAFRGSEGITILPEDASEAARMVVGQGKAYDSDFQKPAQDLRR